MNLTKGKWKYHVSATGSWVVDTDDERIASDVRHYNAPAIAAVPELVEACTGLIEALTKHIEGSNDPFIHLSELDDADRLARAALAKTGGEQQDEEA